MDDSGVGVGGDGSVAWKVVVANVRKGSVVSRSEGDGYLQEGVGETDPGKEFTIGIKIPREGGDAFASALAAAAKDAEAHCHDPGYRVRFPLVIEPKNEDQILITWESSPVAPSASRPSKKTPKRKAASKAKPLAKAATGKTAKKLAKKTVNKTKKKAGKKR